MKDSERVSERIRNGFPSLIKDPDAPIEFRRTNAGYWQLSQGAWSWYFTTKNGLEIGGNSRVRDLARSKRLCISKPVDFNIGHLEVYPIEEVSDISGSWLEVIGDTSH